MDAFKKSALCICLALMGCNENDDDGNHRFGGGTNTLVAFELPKSTALKADVEVKEGLKDLSADWNAKTTVVSETELSFVGNPNLRQGDVFVVNENAYKVESVSAGTAGITKVMVSIPALNEVYKKLELSGKMDAIEFIPNPELLADTPAIAARSMITSKASAEPVKQKLTVDVKRDGFYTVTYSLEKKFTPTLVGEGKLELGAKADLSKWELIGNTGGGTISVYASAEALLKIQKSIESTQDYDDGLCSSNDKLRQGGRILLGTIPLAKIIPAGQSIALVANVDIPVCMVANVKTDMSYDFFNLNGKIESTIVVGNNQAPNVKTQHSLQAIVPPTSAKLGSDATLVSASGKKTFSVEVKAEAGIEFGLEVSDKTGRLARAGVSVAALVTPSLKGTFGGELVSKNFTGLDAEPTACLELKVDTIIRTKAFVDSFLSDAPLALVGNVPFPVVGEKIKKYGTCKEESKNYVKISATGQQLPYSATDWNCVLDKQTGLMWEHKTDDAGLRDKDHTYSWFENSSGYADSPDYYTPENGFSSIPSYVKPYGYHCANTLAKCNTKAFIAAVNSQKLCGYSNWRLPNKGELEAISIKQDKAAYLSDDDYYYWSASTLRGISDSAWGVWFSSGSSSGDSKYNNSYVRAVRAGQ